MDILASENGVIHIASSHSVAASLDRLETLVREKGMRVFARIDQKIEAEQAGLTLRPTQLLLFGNPKAGTLLMQASPSIAIDLPLKVLAWEDEAGQVWLSYNSPEYLQQRHHLDVGLVQNLAGIHALVQQTAK